MTDREFDQLRLAVALVAMLGLTLAAGGGVAPAVADHNGQDESVTDKMVGASESAADAASFGLGVARGKLASLSVPFFGDEPQGWSADSTADVLVQDVSGNASAYEPWFNERLDAGTDQDVLKVTLENETATETLYVTADVTDGSYTNLTATRTTDRTVDESCTLTGEAGRNATDELETFRTEFVEPGEDVSKAYMGRMAGQYSSDIDCTFLD